MLRASVPKAAVHEHRDALTRKDEVGTTSQPPQGGDVLAKAKPKTMYCGPNGYLWATVPCAVTLHDFPHS